ncbi:hypothetical protein STAS_04923 [Striga asiatica]|uniref:VAN3-binding protein-like auxin canalisation domain-containing protein n=1 Tax=Striga asiatica TaxID=4170 RepID=A0A5A7P8C5_STRAF|nr:hypothetical protein STAS_04923 [Striga asiatica]
MSRIENISGYASAHNGLRHQWGCCPASNLKSRELAKAMGATREQVSNIIGSIVGGTSVGKIVSLTAADATWREGHGSRLDGSMSVLPFKDSNEVEFDFQKCMSVLARGVELLIETGNCV